MAKQLSDRLVREADPIGVVDDDQRIGRELQQMLGDFAKLVHGCKYASAREARKWRKLSLWRSPSRSLRATGGVWRPRYRRRTPCRCRTGPVRDAAGTPRGSPARRW